MGLGPGWTNPAAVVRSVAVVIVAPATPTLPLLWGHSLPLLFPLPLPALLLPASLEREVVNPLSGVPGVEVSPLREARVNPLEVAADLRLLLGVSLQGVRLPVGLVRD